VRNKKLKRHFRLHGDAALAHRRQDGAGHARLQDAILGKKKKWSKKNRRKKISVEKIGIY
jgi:hypothetical protein